MDHCRPRTVTGAGPVEEGMTQRGSSSPFPLHPFCACYVHLTILVSSLCMAMHHALLQTGEQLFPRLNVVFDLSGEVLEGREQ
jgi:hypothetical protein